MRVRGPVQPEWKGNVEAHRLDVSLEDTMSEPVAYLSKPVVHLKTDCAYPNGLSMQVGSTVRPTTRISMRHRV